ncbi:hypothetical protein PIB30_083670 [Stylosanthes scabra]|uniref:Uncharacterized protein n=1 Tax=Stylosanthes scabra TaxID=79078 RepID=A0ABU6TST2_9FABA|nr:hypothetical protein [Stylosanthes scabra]
MHHLTILPLMRPKPIKTRLTRKRYPHSYKECFVPLSNRCGTYNKTQNSLCPTRLNHFSIIWVGCPSRLESKGTDSFRMRHTTTSNQERTVIGVEFIKNFNKDFRKQATPSLINETTINPCGYKFITLHLPKPTSKHNSSRGWKENISNFTTRDHLIKVA